MSIVVFSIIYKIKQSTNPILLLHMHKSFMKYIFILQFLQMANTEWHRAMILSHILQKRNSAFGFLTGFLNLMSEAGVRRWMAHWNDLSIIALHLLNTIFCPFEKNSILLTLLKCVRSGEH